MQKTKIIVDSPSDIPDTDLNQYDIKMVGLPIQLNGESHVERESFSCEAFYPLLVAAQEIPTTSRISIETFGAEYKDAWEKRFTDVIVVTMNAGGSGTNDSAQLAARVFFEDTPEAIGSFSIHVVDSMTHCMAYGYPTVQAAMMAQEGVPAREILEYLRDILCRMEISLVCYTLDYAKKSGRITAAAAVAGSLLGVRPTIAMIDGTTEITSRTRGARKATRNLLDTYRRRRSSPDDLVIVISAAIDEYGQELEQQLEQELGRSIPHYKAGAATTINAGPQMAALCFMGKKRERDELANPSVITYDGKNQDTHLASVCVNGQRTTLYLHTQVYLLTLR